MAGVVPFAFFYEPIKILVSGPVLLGGAVVYFILLRVIAERFGR